MQVSTFKEKLTERIYNNNSNYVIVAKFGDKLGASGVVEKGIEDPINFIDNSMIIAIKNDFKCDVSLDNCKCEIQTDEDEATYTIRENDLVCSLIFSINQDDHKENK